MILSWSWTTFVIEIVNFAILMWLLARFLYQPVTRAIESRQRAIADQLARAEELERRSRDLAEQYEGRLVAWREEKAKLAEAVKEELDAERVKREAALAADLQRERERSEAAARSRARDEARQLQLQASQQATQFCADLLERVASPELEGRLVDATIDDIGTLSADERATLSRSFDGRSEATIITRYPIGDAQRASLVAALAKSLGGELSVRFELRDDVIAGLRIDLGTATIEGNLGDELRWFSRSPETS